MAARPASATAVPCRRRFRKTIAEQSLVVTSVLSGNRNFEGRVHPEVRANYLASPPLVVAYALAGRIDIDFDNEPLGTDASGKPVYLQRHLADPAGGAGRDPPLHHARGVRAQLRRRVQGRCAVAEADRGRDESLRMAGRQHLRQASAVLRRHAGDTRPTARHPPRARAGDPRRFDHDRPHLAGRLDQARQPGRAVPDRTRRGAGRLQQLRRPPRQPRGDDPRHLRQHPPQESASPRAPRAASRATCPTARSCRSSTPRRSTRRRACRW